MNCKNIIEKIYKDEINKNTLSHIKECRECKAEYNLYKKMNNVFDSSESFILSKNFNKKVMNRISVSIQIRMFLKKVLPIFLVCYSVLIAILIKVINTDSILLFISKKLKSIFEIISILGKNIELTVSLFSNTLIPISMIFSLIIAYMILTKLEIIKINGGLNNEKNNIYNM